MIRTRIKKFDIEVASEIKDATAYVVGVEYRQRAQKQGLVQH